MTRGEIPSTKLSVVERFQGRMPTRNWIFFTYMNHLYSSHTRQPQLLLLFVQKCAHILYCLIEVSILLNLLSILMFSAQEGYETGIQLRFRLFSFWSVSKHSFSCFNDLLLPPGIAPIKLLLAWFTPLHLFTQSSFPLISIFGEAMCHTLRTDMNVPVVRTKSPTR